MRLFKFHEQGRVSISTVRLKYPYHSKASGGMTALFETLFEMGDGEIIYRYETLERAKRSHEALVHLYQSNLSFDEICNEVDNIVHRRTVAVMSESLE